MSVGAGEMAIDASLCTEILAKPNESLEKHTDKAIKFLLEYFKWQRKNIDKVAGIAGIDGNELKSRVFATVYLHDIGKANPDFQKHIRDEKRHGGRSAGIPHPLLSLPFLLSAVPPLNDIRYEALAVMSHHTPFYDDLYSNHRKAVTSGKYCLEKAENFYNHLPSVHENKMGYPYPFKLEKPRLDEAGGILDSVKDLYFPPQKTREIFSFFVTAIHYADWLASGDFSTYEYSEKRVKEKIARKMAENRDFKGWYDFQTKAGNVRGNVFIRIPTGQGKTEAVLLWANTNVSDGKLMYFLPTRVTSNAMYERLQGFFGENVGISHGASALIIAEEKGWGSRGYWDKKLLSSVFMMPVMVTTVDQLLLAGFNWFHWELIEQNTASSTMIFDEIHSYDTYTTALIFNSVEDLKERSTKFAFMSATFPNYLLEGLKSILGEATIIQDKDYDNLCRHRLHLIGAPIDEGISNILRKYKEGKKVLVITDTVGKSIEIYGKLKEKLKPDGIVLYHSRFIERDRRRKEKKISDGAKGSGGFVAVTTQVVEVSLDIDYDILYTEVAPIDALVQRMGRVNRKGRKNIVDVFVFEPSEGGAYVYGADNLRRARDILAEVNGKEITEGDIKSLVELQYPVDETLKKLEIGRKKLRADLRKLRNDLWQIQTLQLSEESKILRKFARTREERFPDIEVIPWCFREDIEKVSHPAEIIQFVVRVPLRMVIGHLNREGRNVYANIGYDCEYGVKGDENEAVII